MADTVFVNVERTLHGDTMYIPKEVQEKYPKLYILIPEVDPVIECQEIIKEATNKRKTRSK